MTKAGMVVDMIIDLLPKTNNHRIWSNGEEILCETEQLAECIADLFDAIYGGQAAVTGYYDDEWHTDDPGSEDTNVDGWYYVNV